MKRTIAFIVALALLTLCAACGTPAPTPTATAPAEQPAATTAPAATEAPATEAPATEAPAGEPVAFTVPVWSPDDYDRLTELDLVGKVKAAIPNLTVTVELHKDVEYENDIKIMKNGGQLPDVFPLQGKWLATFQEDLAPVNELAAYANYIDSIKPTGTAYGIAQAQFNEFVFYRKSIFAEYGIEVPKTWDELIAAGQKIKEGKKYTPILMAGLDGWVDYPYNEFMPSIVAKDGNYWSTLAANDAPFTDGQPIYKAYQMCQKLYDAKVMGDDPMGLNFDQVTDQFVAGQGAIIAMGSWFMDTIVSKGIDTADIGVFILPVRENATDPLVTTSMLETFWCINKNTKHMAEAEAFINFWFSDAWYPAYIAKTGTSPVLKNVDTSYINPLFAEALKAPDLQFIAYNDGSAEFMTRKDKAKFDAKGVGFEQIVKSDFENLMKGLNEKWAAAK